jgi:predicted nucleotidyltransferase
MFMTAKEATLERLLKDKREEILSLAEQHGAANVRIFGSVARGEAGPESDIDVLVTPGLAWSLLDRIRFQQALEALLGRSVDVVTDSTLHWRIRARTLDEARPL